MDPAVSRITIVTSADMPVVEQIKKQLNKLINVIKVYELTGNDFVEREMALIKVKALPEHRAEILRIVDIFRCKVVDVGLSHYTIEVTGTEEKLSALLVLLKPIGIKEIAKTGVVALFREPK
jgi:acetolactate synthase-1/3 small subunit